MKELRAGRLARLVSVAARRPRTTLAIAAACTALGVVGAARIRPEVSIQGMLSEDNASARALANVADEFAVADELVVLAEVPSVSALMPAETRSRLLGFARRLSDALLSPATPGTRCAAVSYRALPQLRDFIQAEVVPAGLHYLDEGQLANLRARLSLDGFRQQFRRNEELITTPGPAGSGLAKTILKDPLRLHEFYRRGAAPKGSSFARADEAEPLLSMDGHAILVRITGDRPVSDLEYAKFLTQHVRSVVQQVNLDGLSIRYTGAYEIATTAERRIRADMIRSITWSVILLFVLFLLVYRNIAAFPLAATPVAVGIVIAFGVSSLGSAHLTPIVAVIGALLAGLAIDSCVHFLSHYTRQRSGGANNDQALVATLSTVGPAMAAACVTSIVGFLAISQSSVRGLREFAILGALGLGCALVAAFTVLPALLTVATSGAKCTAEPRLRRGLIEPLLSRLLRNPRSSVALSLLAVALCISMAALSPEGMLRFGADVDAMHPEPNPALAAQSAVAERFELPAESLLIHLTADSSQQLVARAHQVQARLRRQDSDSHQAFDTFGLASLLPDPALRSSTSDRLAQFDPDQVIADFETALSDSVFNPDVYSDYRAFLRRFLSADATSAPTVATLLGYPALARLLLPRTTSDSADPWQTITLVHAHEPLESRDALTAIIDTIRTAIADVPGATLTGLPVLGHDTEKMIRHDLAKLLPIAGGVVLVWLGCFFRRVTDTVLALLPTLFGLSCLLGVMALIDLRLNTVNLVGLPLLIGIGVDDGIFLVSLARTIRRAGTTSTDLADHFGTGCHAVLMTTATTLVTFGTLVFTSVPAIRSLGMLLGIGMAACFAGTLFLLVPILALRHRNGTAQ